MLKAKNKAFLCFQSSLTTCFHTAFHGVNMYRFKCVYRQVFISYSLFVCLRRSSISSLGMWFLVVMWRSYRKTTVSWLGWVLGWVMGWVMSVGKGGGSGGDSRLLLLWTLNDWDGLTLAGTSGARKQSATRVQKSYHSLVLTPRDSRTTFRLVRLHVWTLFRSERTI